MARSTSGNRSVRPSTTARGAVTASREEGYWVGALVVNIGAAIGLFFLVFVGGLVETWPDVPWTGLLIATLVVMALAPLLLYRQSKTIWVWLDLEVHPYGGDERDWERP